MGNEAASLVLARIDLEILFGAVEVKQDLGDGAIAFATQASVERAQRQDVPLPQLGGQRAEIATRRMATQRAAEPACGVRTQVVEGVERQERSVESWRIGNGLRQPELMCDAIDLPDAMPAIRGVAQIETIEMRQRDDRLGCGVTLLYRGERDGLWLKAWNPEQGLPIGGCLRIGRKIEAPSDSRRLPAVQGQACPTRLGPETHDDNRRGGEDIPKRNRQRECSWQIYMPPENASRCSAWRYLSIRAPAKQRPDREL